LLIRLASLYSLSNPKPVTTLVVRITTPTAI